MAMFPDQYQLTGCLGGPIMIPNWEQNMRLIGREKLNRLRGRGTESEKWARAWVAEVTDAHWRQADDVTEQFPNARHQGQGCFVFPIGHCQLAIQLRVAFAQGIALISDLTTCEVNYGS